MKHTSKWLALAAVLSIGTVLKAEVKEVKPGNLVPLKLGNMPVTGHAKYFIAKDTGIFEREGLDVQLLEFTNSADGLAAIRAGKLDGGAFGTTAPLVHIDKGADLRIIAGIMGEDAALITKPENVNKIKTIPDLKGKRIATVRLATGDAVLRGALEQSGLDWKKDIKLFELKNPPAVLEAVKTGQVDVGVVWGPHDLRAEAQGLAVIIRSRSLQAGHPCCRLVVQSSELAKRPEIWVKVIRSLLLAQKFANDNHEKTVDIIAANLKLDKKLVDQAYYHGFLDQSTDPNRKGIELFWKTMQASDFVKSKDSIDKFIDPSIYKKALDSLVKEYPAEPFWAELEKQFASRN